MKKQQKANKTRWHRLLGSVLEQVLTPVGISVQCDAKVMVNPPEADILLLRRETECWTTAQRQRLADGIRHSRAGHILLEFKYTESFNESALQQTLGYDFFYKRANHLQDEDVQSFLLSAKTPNAKTLDNFGYQPSQYRGIYHSETPVLRKVILIVLNELADTPHNAWIKCFASRQQQKKKAFALLKLLNLATNSTQLSWLVSGLSEYFFDKELGMHMNNEMDIELTPERLMAWGKSWGQSYMSHASVDEVLAAVDHQKLLDKLDVKERLAGLDVKERLAGLSVQEIEAYIQQLKKLSDK